MKRVLLTCTALACLGLALAASRNGETTTVATRIDNAFSDLSKVQAPIPHLKLHAKALELLNTRVVAADEESSKLARDLGADDLARIESCVTFSKTTLERTNCY